MACKTLCDQTPAGLTNLMSSNSLLSSGAVLLIGQAGLYAVHTGTTLVPTARPLRLLFPLPQCSPSRFPKPWLLLILQISVPVSPLLQRDLSQLPTEALSLQPSLCAVTLFYPLPVLVTL